MPGLGIHLSVGDAGRSALDDPILLHHPPLQLCLPRVPEGHLQHTVHVGRRSVRQSSFYSYSELV